MFGKKKQAQDSAKKMSGMKKYRVIIVSVVLFLLFDISILMLNYYQSFEASKSAAEISIASRQIGLMQSISKELTDINLIAQRDFYRNGKVDVEGLKSVVYAQYDELNRSSALFEQSQQAVLNGGRVSGIDGNEVDLEPVGIPAAAGNLEKIEGIWRPFYGLIQNFITGYRNNDVSIKNIQYAADYARIYSRRILAESNDVVGALQRRAENQARIVRIIQVAGIFIAVGIFFFIVFVALRTLIRTDAELGKARKEVDEIMDTIQEGLFLIDSDLRIGTQQSKELADIFPVKDITGRLLDEVVRGMVGEADLTNTKRFINQLFNKRVKENLLDDLNPLREVKLMLSDDDGRPLTRYLRFKFNRVYENKQIVRVLVTVSDITEAVKLQSLLEQERRQNQVQTEMLVKVLHLDQELLAGFVRRTTQITRRVNALLKSDGSSQSALRKKLDDIYREVHSFKGEASVLEFDSFVAIAEEAEERLKQLRGQGRLTGNDFIGVTVVLDRLIALNEEIAQIQAKLADFGKQEGADDNAAVDKSSPLVRNMEHFAHQIAGRQHKQVELMATGFEEALNLPQQTEDGLREIVTQLLRNAIVHGIELPDEREAKGKGRAGNITLTYKQKDGRGELAVQDDGAGIDLDALRGKLRNDPRYQDKDVDSMDAKLLYRALFLPGFSTAEGDSEDAGRGEGMSIVRDRIKHLPEGKIAIHSVPGSLTRFVIAFSVHDIN